MVKFSELGIEIAEVGPRNAQRKTGLSLLVHLSRNR